MLPGGKAGPPSATQGVGRDCRAPAAPGPIQEISTLAGLPAAKRPWPARVRVRASESKARPQGHLFPTGPGAHSTWHLADGGGGEGGSFGKSAILGGFAVTRGCQGLRGLSGQLLPPWLLGCLKTEAQGAWDLIALEKGSLALSLPRLTLAPCVHSQQPPDGELSGLLFHGQFPHQQSGLSGLRASQWPQPLPLGSGLPWLPPHHLPDLVLPLPRR